MEELKGRFEYVLQDDPDSSSLWERQSRLFNTPDRLIPCVKDEIENLKSIGIVSRITEDSFQTSPHSPPL